MPEWVRVGRAAEWTVGRGRSVDLDGKAVAVFRTRDRWLAFTDACPHMGASLADGRLVGNDVECVWHRWRYDVDTGRTKEREWACLDRYEIREEGGEVFLLRPDPPPPPPEEDDPEWLDWEPDRFFRKPASRE